MISNYFKIAFRNIKRYPAYSVLNITGMAIGMACAFLLLLWVYDEWSYDRHFKNADNIYRIIENENPSGGNISLSAATPGALSETLKEEYPEIVRSSRFINLFIVIKKGDDFIEEGIVAAEKDFLKMFDIEFIRGDIKSALNDPASVIITEKIAKKYFGNEDPVGQTLPLSAEGFELTISGVIKSLPINSHLHFDFLVPIEFSKKLGGDYNDWDVLDYNYIELKDGTDSKLFEAKIRDFLKTHKKGSNAEIFLQNIKKIHLYSSRKYTYDISGHGDITYVRIMGLIAVFILIIACINFMNLSIAQSARRAKEIGVRKVAGANKQKIISQFLGESLLIVFVALVIAMILVELLLPGFNIFTGKQLALDYLNAGLYLGLITLLLFCGLLAGSYPALYLSSLKPLDTMKGVIIKNPGSAGIRRMLVIFQFSSSVMLIICTLIIGNQTSYMQNKNLGFNKDNIGYFQFPTAPWDPKLETVKKELLKNPDILSVTRAFNNPFNIENYSDDYKWTGKKEGDNVSFYILTADADYARTFKLELEEGRFFSPEFPTDASAIVINRTAAKVLGFKNPVGEILTNHVSKSTIIGVVKDFHYKSLHYKIEPLIMGIGGSNVLYVRMKPEHIPSTVEAISKIYNSFNPSSPLVFHFLDDDFSTLYRTERKSGKIVGCFSFLAIIISCLGLLGLSAFMTVRRTKEIGIRKTNGAKSAQILSLLLQEYIKLVFISILIACPISWYTMNLWLQSFAYRINMRWWLFALAGILLMVITMLTIGFQSYKAASRNPVEALRYE